MGKQPLFSSILIANRGEIAVRIIHAARLAGLRCVAVFTDADADAPHVALADQAVNIGAGAVGDSYLSIETILAAAAESGAGAIHPGYGFLSENADFAEACIAAGLVFIGPPAEAVRIMGNKATAKRLMIAAGVACVPGYEGAEQSPEGLMQQAADIGYPVMIKAASGGGGRGMRLVQAKGFLSALTRAKSEALGAFGSDEVIVERALANPRHIEVQVFADHYGEVVHLFERDCSLQRRHQKVVEEAPAPGISARMRADMGGAAVKAAQAVAYEGAGTVEFLLDQGGAFYFLEMNTRLQVEHPVTEMITGLDLVALQISVAQGQPLGLVQADITLSGHAIEARLYAEDPARDFQPVSGRIRRWHPPEGKGIRVDSGILEGQMISPFYDPMLAKIIAFAPTREAARRRLVDALKDTVLFGPASNRDFLHTILEHPLYRQGGVGTGFIETAFDGGKTLQSALVFTEIALAAALLLREVQRRAQSVAVRVSDDLLGWGSPGYLSARMRLSEAGSAHDLELRQHRDGRLEIRCADNTATITGKDGQLRVNGNRIDLRAVQYDGSTIFVATGNKTFALVHERVSAALNKAVDGGHVTAPMHGSLVEICVAKGDAVTPGTRLAVLEAMKMQHELLSTICGTVSSLPVPVGAQVKAGDLLVEITGAAS